MQTVLFQKAQRLVQNILHRISALKAATRRFVRTRLRDPLNITASLRALNNLT